jgi:hypothetical protein
MKRVILSTISGLALLALVPATAQARVNVNLDLGIPLYVEPSERYYAPPPPVYYGPSVIYEDRGWDEHRGRWQRGRRDWGDDGDRHGWHDHGEHRGHDHRD